MPRGFVGNAANSYRTLVMDAHERASTAAATIATNPPQGVSVPRAIHLGPIANTSGGGSFQTGRNDSSNVVVSANEYSHIMRRVSDVDYNIGHCIYQCINEIEEMCSSIFRMPVVSSRCIDVSTRIKGCMNIFTDLTSDLEVQTRNFARDIETIE